MNDVVAVALISAGSSLLGASVGALTTYKVNLRNTEATIATAQSQHDVDVARIESENRLLRENNREEERRNRQSTYHQHLNAAVETYQLMGFAASPKKINDLRDNFRYLHSGVVLFGPPSVRTAAYNLSAVYNEIWPGLRQQREDNPGKSESECWRDATIGIREKFGEKIGDLTAVMHADVTKDIAEDSTEA